MTKEPEPTISDVLEAIHGFADLTEDRFKTMVTKDYLEECLEKTLGPIQSSMVTKDYLDGKLSDLRGDLVVLTRKEDTKLHALVDILHDRRVIDDADVRRVERLEPFAR